MEENVQDRNDKGVLSVEAIPLFSEKQCEALKARWITTMDAFAAAAATAEGRTGLCGLLDVDAAALEALLGKARELLGDERYAALTVPSPGGPLGALLEENFRDKPGLWDKGKEEEHP